MPFVILSFATCSFVPVRLSPSSRPKASSSHPGLLSPVALEIVGTMEADEGSEDELELAQVRGPDSKQRSDAAGHRTVLLVDRCRPGAMGCATSSNTVNARYFAVVCSKVPWIHGHSDSPFKRFKTKLAAQEKQSKGLYKPIPGNASQEGGIAANKPKRARTVKHAQNLQPSEEEEDDIPPQKKGRKDKDSVQHMRARAGEPSHRAAPQDEDMQGGEQVAQRMPGVVPETGRRANGPVPTGQPAAERLGPDSDGVVWKQVLDFCKGKWPTRFSPTQVRCALCFNVVNMLQAVLFYEPLVWQCAMSGMAASR